MKKSFLLLSTATKRNKISKIAIGCFSHLCVNTHWKFTVCCSKYRFVLDSGVFCLLLQLCYFPKFLNIENITSETSIANFYLKSCSNMRIYCVTSKYLKTSAKNYLIELYLKRIFITSPTMVEAADTDPKQNISS